MFSESYRKICSIAVLLLFVIHLSSFRTGNAMHDFGEEEEYGDHKSTVKNETIIEIKTNSTVTPLSEPEVQHARDLEAEKRFPETQVDAVVSGEDPCENLKSCSECTRQRQCGWCDANMKCVAGGPKRPKADNVCPLTFWSYSFCPGRPCPKYSDCKSCLSDPTCGWCAGAKNLDEDDGSSTEGTCSDGGADGPFNQNEDASNLA